MNPNYLVRLSYWGVVAAAYFCLTTAVQAQAVEQTNQKTKEQKKELSLKGYLMHSSEEHKPYGYTPLSASSRLTVVGKISIEDIPLRNAVSTSARDLFLKDTAESFGLASQPHIAQNNLTRVTGVELNQTDRGLQVILETAGGQLVPLILPEGNNLVIDLLDATLDLPTGNEYRQTNPSPGINEIALTPVDASSIRLTITGETQAPDAEIVPSDQNEVGFGGSLSNIDTDSFTGIAQAGVSAKQNNFDYRFNVAYDRIGAFFDGEGDRIPPDLQSSQGSLAETNNLNLFGKVGYELGEHRL